MWTNQIDKTMKKCRKQERERNKEATKDSQTSKNSKETNNTWKNLAEQDKYSP